MLLASSRDGRLCDSKHWLFIPQLMIYVLQTFMQTMRSCRDKKIFSVSNITHKSK